MDPDPGLDPCWSQTHFVGFVMTPLICLFDVNVSHHKHHMSTFQLYWYRKASGAPLCTISGKACIEE
jgi:hypothetical protein